MSCSDGTSQPCAALQEAVSFCPASSCSENPERTGQQVRMIPLHLYTASVPDGSDAVSYRSYSVLLNLTQIRSDADNPAISALLFSSPPKTGCKVSCSHPQNQERVLLFLTANIPPPYTSLMKKQLVSSPGSDIFRFPTNRVSALHTNYGISSFFFLFHTCFFLSSCIKYEFAATHIRYARYPIPPGAFR